jgi:hypothetical protein
MKCADCKHWSKTYDIQWGSCVRAQSEGGNPMDTKTLAWAADMEQFQGVLYTHENFGCVQFEKRDE